MQNNPTIDPIIEFFNKYFKRINWINDFTDLKEHDINHKFAKKPSNKGSKTIPELTEDDKIEIATKGWPEFKKKGDEVFNPYIKK